MSEIYFVKSNDREKFTLKIIEKYHDKIDKAKKIFLKPNIVSYELYPTTTHPVILETIIKQLSSHEIVVGDAPAVDVGRSNKIIAESPLKKVCDRHGVKLINLYKEKMETVKSSRGYKIKISTLPLTCDFVISLPVLKTHFMVGLSGAIKNQFGYLSKSDRLLMHGRIKNLNKGIVEVNAAVPTDLFIVDAVETMILAQECRHGGCKSGLGYLFAGSDPVALDCYGLELLREVEPNFEEIKQKARYYIDYAESIGLGATKYNEINI